MGLSLQWRTHKPCRTLKLPVKQRLFCLQKKLFLDLAAAILFSSMCSQDADAKVTSSFTSSPFFAKVVLTELPFTLYLWTS